MGDQPHIRALTLRRWAALVAAFVLAITGATTADVAAHRRVDGTPHGPASAIPEGLQVLAGRLTPPPAPVLASKRGGERATQPTPVAAVLPSGAGRFDGTYWQVTGDAGRLAGTEVAAARGRGPPMATS